MAIKLSKSAHSHIQSTIEDITSAFNLSLEQKSQLNDVLSMPTLLAADFFYVATYEETLDTILHLSGKYGLNEALLLAAYKQLFANTNEYLTKKITKLEKTFKSIQTGEKIFNELLSFIQVKKSPSEIEYLFKSNLKVLTLYLRAQHAKMLAAIQPDKANYQLIQKGFRAILLAAAQIGRPYDSAKTLGEKIQQYEKTLNEKLKNGALEHGAIANNYSIAMPSMYEIMPYRSYKFSYKRFQWNNLFFLELYDFRKDYLLRFKESKLKVKLAEKNNGELAEYLEDTRNTFIHGSNGPILTLLSDSFYALHPTGKLNQLDILPLTGELQNGANHDGVNIKYISSTGIENAGMSWHTYAQPSFNFNVKDALGQLTSFTDNIQAYIQEKTKKNHPIIYSQYIGASVDDLVKTQFNLRRLAQSHLTETEIAQFKDVEKKLGEVISLLKTAIHEYKQTVSYRDLATTENLACYFTDFERHEKTFNALYEFLTSTIELKVSIKKKSEDLSMPLIFTSAHVHMQRYERTNDEYVTARSLKLGEDIQTIYTDNQENADKINDWIKRSELQQKVNVKLISSLAKAQEVFFQLQPYLADILSIKKLKSIQANQDKLFAPKPMFTALQTTLQKVKYRATTALNKMAALRKIVNPSFSKGWALILIPLAALKPIFSWPLTLTISLVSYSFYRTGSFLKFAFLSDEVARKADAKQIKFDAHSSQADAYYLGRSAQKSWLVYGASFLMPKAYSRSYYLGTIDEINKVDSAFRLRKDNKSYPK